MMFAVIKWEQLRPNGDLEALFGFYDEEGNVTNNIEIEQDINNNGNIMIIQEPSEK